MGRNVTYKIRWAAAGSPYKNCAATLLFKVVLLIEKMSKNFTHFFK